MPEAADKVQEKWVNHFCFSSDKLKKKIQAEVFIVAFEKLLLPNLKESKKGRHTRKSSLPTYLNGALV